MFITAEGIEGAGKSTLLRLLAERFRAEGRTVLLTREPGGSGLGLSLRALLLHAETRVTGEAELFLFLADRAEHVAGCIRPALAEGHVVLCDRYTDSTVVYQGWGRGLDIAAVNACNTFATGNLEPDLTFVLDVDPAVGLARARGRNVSRGVHESEGRFEMEALSFHTRIRQGFLDWAGRHPERCVILNGGASPEDLLEAAWTAIAVRFPPA